MERSAAKAAELYALAAEQGHVPAQIRYGFLLRTGNGVAEDDTAALSWYLKAAQAGDTTAQYVLARMYDAGEGTEVDLEQALHWLRSAAKQDEPNAQAYLGLMHADGRGLKQSWSRAVYWNRRAALNGNNRAAANLRAFADKLAPYTVTNDGINIRSKPNTGSAVVRKAEAGELAYSLRDRRGGWKELYFPADHTIGHVADYLLVEARYQEGQQLAANSER